MIEGLSAPAVYRIYVQIHYSIKHIESRRQIRKIDAKLWIIFWVKIAKTLFAFSGNQFEKNAKVRQMDTPVSCWCM